MLLENHYHNSLVNGIPTGLRLLDTQMSGIVVLSQVQTEWPVLVHRDPIETSGSRCPLDACSSSAQKMVFNLNTLLACSFFCLFPSTNRNIGNLRAINFDMLFVSLHQKPDEKQRNKIKCIVHYFERIFSEMPTGNVSFERKVTALEYKSSRLSYPNARFWRKSTVPLCRFEVRTSGFIEDQPYEAIEVDFANKLLGGGALKRGCVQEEIRFMINPELISGILFLPAMKENEAIEMVGAERFANYTGYSSSFVFSGNHVDQRDIDSMGRRKTRIIAIDALRLPGKRQYELELILREINKAFCGFLDQRKDDEYQKLFLDEGISGSVTSEVVIHRITLQNSTNTCMMPVEDAIMSSTVAKSSDHEWTSSLMKFKSESQENQNEIGIATGNWGCGAFGGDPEIKTMIQWLAASQALRPFVLCYTFGLESLDNLDEVVNVIASRKYTVGDLWNMFVKYTSKRVKRKTVDGFFQWLLST
ncbi:glycosidase [Lithospermum erythrorhizon]|uniref:poly(ADP-ribose) glycohydrolase n=1 Tax=Lithospermum erythrorhizon TaxID=34254 RepID=A0AAV3QMY1_LITER